MLLLSLYVKSDIINSLEIKHTIFLINNYQFKLCVFKYL